MRLPVITAVKPGCLEITRHQMLVFPLHALEIAAVDTNLQLMLAVKRTTLFS